LPRDKDPDVYHLLAILAGTPYANTFAYLIKPLEDLLSKRELTLYDATNSNNQIKIIDDQIEEKRKQLYNGIKTIQDKLDFKQQNLKYRIDESEKKFSSLPPKEVEYARLTACIRLMKNFIPFCWIRKLNIRFRMQVMFRKM
jgi:hypothetical protein